MTPDLLPALAVLVALIGSWVDMRVRTSNGNSPLSKQITRELERLERRIDRHEDRYHGPA